MYSDLMLLLACTTPLEQGKKNGALLWDFLIDMCESMGRGFKYILDGMNVERSLVLCVEIGDGRGLPRTSIAYVNERRVFDRSSCLNRTVQFPAATTPISASCWRPSGLAGSRSLPAEPRRVRLRERIASSTYWACHARFYPHSIFGGPL